MNRDPLAKEISLVVVSDIHAGSRSAVVVPDMPLSGGGGFRYSASQAALYRAWCELAKEWAKPDIIVVNGDALEGQARKESGVPCWSTDMDDQIMCAKMLVEEFKAKKTYVINGTGYHVDAGGKSLEHWLGSELKAEKIGKGGQFSEEELFLKVGQSTFHFCHHIATGTGWYRTTPLAREMVFALLNETDKHRVDVVIRSHVHSFAGVEFNRQRGYTTPCWQGQTRYMIRKSALGLVPTIGALRFIIRADEVKLEKRFFRPVEMKPKLFVYEATSQQ